MTKDKDYTFTVKNNTNVGNAIVTITGKGNYNGIYSTSFAITKAQAVITCKSNVTYTGSSQTIATCNSTGGLSNAQQTNVGSYSVGCNGDSNYLRFCCTVRRQRQARSTGTSLRPRRGPQLSLFGS